MQDPEPNTSRCCGDFRAKFDEWKKCAEKSVREEPVKTAGLAFAAGIALTILPVGRIVGGLVRLAFALVQPALLILGVVKVVEEIDKQKKP
jgi:heme/copper-type cytochrome/quinol oxidase subunit 4